MHFVVYFYKGVMLTLLKLADYNYLTQAIWFVVLKGDCFTVEAAGLDESVEYELPAFTV